MVDWPSPDVPASFVRAGWNVVVRGGPGPADYSAYELYGGEVVVRARGRPPDRADLVYSYRPLAELADIVATAQALGARAAWVQSGVDNAGRRDPRGCWLADDHAEGARAMVEAAGLAFLHEPYVGDALRGASPTPP